MPDAEVVLAVAAGRIEYRAARHVGLGDEAGGSDVAGRRLPGPGADGTVAELAWRSGATRRLCRTTPDPSRGEREAGTLLASALRPRSGRQASGPAQFGSRLPRGRFPTRTRPSIPSAVPCPHRPSERPRLVSRAASRPDRAQRFDWPAASHWLRRGGRRSGLRRVADPHARSPPRCLAATLMMLIPCRSSTWRTVSRNSGPLSATGQ